MDEERAVIAAAQAGTSTGSPLHISRSSEVGGEPELEACDARRVVALEVRGPVIPVVRPEHRIGGRPEADRRNDPRHLVADVRASGRERADVVVD